MSYRIFIAYSGEDEKIADYTYSCLSNIVEFRPYKSEIFPVFGTNFKDRIKKEIRESFSMVAFFTSNSINSQWVNQEIGYAVANQEITRGGRPYIIPISTSEVASQLKGFITKDSEDILFMDKYPDFDWTITRIITFIRDHIPKGDKEGILCFVDYHLEALMN